MDQEEKRMIQNLDLLNDNKYGSESFESTEEWSEEEKQREIDCKNIRFDTTRTKELKEMCRLGLSISVRRRYWFILSGGYDLFCKIGDVYNSAVENAKKIPINENSNFGITFKYPEFVPQGIANILPNFLHVVWYNNQYIKYSPLIPAISTMLLSYMEPSLAYISLQAMINKSRKTSFYLLLDKTQLYVTIEAVEKLIVSRLPQIAHHCGKLNIILSQLILSILPSIFYPFISFNLSLRIFDSFVSEGRKVLLRFLLQILIDLKNNLLLTSDSNEFNRLIFTSINRLNDPVKMKEFSKKAFKIKMKWKSHIEKLERNVNGMSDGLKSKLNAQMQKAIEPSDYNPKVRHRRTKTLYSHNTNGSDNKIILSPQTNKDEKTEVETMKNIQEQIAKSYLPTVFTNGERNVVFKEQMLLSIINNLPPIFRLYSCDLVFKMSVHGSHLLSLYSRCNSRCQYIMIIKTNTKIIGAFLSDFQVDKFKGHYFGTGMTMVFDIDKSLFFKLRYSPNNYFICGSDDSLMIGGPDPALFIPNGFDTVYSKPCETFKSPILTENQNGDGIIDFEMYKFVPIHTIKKRRKSITSI